MESGGIVDIARERKRQVEEEGWTAEHDDNEHADGDLASAGACYALPINVLSLPVGVIAGNTILAILWPFMGEWWKPKDRRRNLVRAGALIAAEIDRLDRLAAKGEK